MSTQQPPTPPRVLSILKAVSPVKTAVDLAKDLGARSLRVEVLANGYLSECPNRECREAGKGVASFAFAQIGDDVVADCFAGCASLEGVGPYPAVILKADWLETRRANYETTAAMLAALEKLPRPAALRTPRARTLKEFLALKAPPRVELCGPWLRAQTITEVYGWRGAGKSWFCLHLAYCVSAGVDFMKWSCKEARRVVYVDGELGLSDSQERLARFIEAEEARAGRPLDSKLCILSDSDLEQFPDGLPKLSTPEGRATVEAQLEGPSLVILDNLSTLFNSAIENDAESWTEAQDWLLSLRRRGHSVLFVHHSGKGGQQRGTSKREDICDTVIALKQPEDHQAEQGAAFLLKFEKSRGVHGPDVASFDARLTEDEHGLLVWALSNKEPSKAEQIETLLRGGASAQEIAKLAGFTKSQVYKVAGALASKQPTGVSCPTQSYTGGSPQSSPLKGGRRGLSDSPQRQPKEDQRTGRGLAEDQASAKPRQQRELPKETRGLGRGLAEDWVEDQPQDAKSCDVSKGKRREDWVEDQRTGRGLGRGLTEGAEDRERTDPPEQEEEGEVYVF